MMMRTEKRGCAPQVLVLMAAFLVLSDALAGGQQEFDLPQQSSQGTPPVYHHPTTAPTPIPYLAPGTDVRTLPQIEPQFPSAAPSTASQAPTYQAQPQPTPVLPPSSASESQPVLPAVFRGCWEGRVDYVDSLQRLPGAPKLGFWTPKTYRLCYRRLGSGPFVLTFTEAGMEHNDRITNAEGRMTLLSSDGRHYASMRSDLDFDEYRTHPSYFGSNTFVVHEVAALDCTVEPDGMHVNGVVTGWRDGAPWFRARWHSVFIHQGEPPQQVEAPPGGVPE
jgi:hypothetical protein